MSDASHAVVRGPKWREGGYRPVLTPAHHVALLTGISLSTSGSLRKPWAFSALVDSVWFIFILVELQWMNHEINAVQNFVKNSSFSSTF
jgi:hypothetical protein